MGDSTYLFDELFNNLHNVFVKLMKDKCLPLLTVHYNGKEFKTTKKSTFIAFMADFVTDIIFAREIGGFKSIMENNYYF